MADISKIKQYIDLADTLSFDIFDTLLLPLVMRREDIFELVAKKTGITGFAEERAYIGSKCAENTKKNAAVTEKLSSAQNGGIYTLDDIYSILEQTSELRTGEYSWEQLKNIEKETLAKLVTRSETMYSLLKYAKRLGKTVICISDCLLHADDIWKLFEKHGIEGVDRIYLSSMVGRSKANSEIYDYVAEQEQTSAYRILHIGSNFKTDVENARNCGFNAVMIDNAQESENTSLFLSVCKSAANVLKSTCSDFWYGLGAEAAGGLYCRLIFEIRRKIAYDKPDKLFFSSRDGYNLYKIFDELKLTDIPMQYFYTSYRALLLCGMKSLDEETRALLPPFRTGDSVRETLDWLDMRRIDEKSLKKSGFSSYNDIIKDKNDFAKFRKLIDMEEDAFFKEVAEERAAFEEYISKTGLLDCNALVFDSGFEGGSRLLLDRALSLLEYKGSNSFVFAGITEATRHAKLEKDKKSDMVVFSPANNRELAKKLAPGKALLKQFFSAPHNSVHKYAKTESCGYTLETEETTHAHKESVLRGITDLVRLALPILEEYDIFMSDEDCLCELVRLIENPTPEEAAEIGVIDIPDEVKELVRENTDPNKDKPKQKPEKRPNVVQRVMGYVNGYGVATTAYMIKNKLAGKDADKAYESFIQNTENDILETEPLDYKPLFSFVVPVYNTADEQLKECIESVLCQTYDNFELILVDDCSTQASVRNILSAYEGREKVNVLYRSENGHISKCTNTAISVAKGEYLVFMDCDDTVAPNAVYELTKAVNNDKSIDFIYSDEDKLDENGRRHFPHFKPDWSPDTFMCLMYTNHLAAYRKSIVDEIGGLRSEFDGAQDYDMTLRFIEKTNRIAHIPKVLYHWRQQPNSVAADIDAKPYVKEAMLRLKEDALKRRGIEGDVVYVPEVSQYRVVYKPVNEPLVSIVIPSKDNYAVYERCITSLVEKTLYKNYEIITIDNGSSDENKTKYRQLCDKTGAVYQYQKRDFNFSVMCNMGAESANGEFLLFLNDDMEIIDGSWLGIMVGQAMQKHTGAVGAKLLYPESTAIQHCGVINLPIGPGHAFSPFDDSAPLYFGRNKLDYNYIAVTAACLCIRKSTFDAIGGFDEELAVAYNDVEFCFRLHEKGLYNVVRTDAVLWHHESVSRGSDEESVEKKKRLGGEMELLYNKHPKLRGKDPFYNPNLVKNKVDFGIDVTDSGHISRITGADIDITPYLNANVRANLDRVNEGEVTEIDGWAYVDGIKLNNCNKKRVLLINEENRALAAETRTVIRLDISAAYGKKGSLNLSGFGSSIDTTLIRPGRYRIGILLENTVTLKKYAAVFDRYIRV